jgi:hypothetical protein
MIHLDANYLIGLLVKGSPQAQEVDGWLAGGQTLAASSIAWTEFLNGPVTPLEVTRVESVLQSRIVPFGRAEAALASALFNKTGLRRRQFWHRRKLRRQINQISRSSCHTTSGWPLLPPQSRLPFSNRQQAIDLMPNRQE